MTTKINFVSLIFTLNLFDSSTPFMASRLPFSQKQSDQFGHFNINSGDPFIRLNTTTWCNHTWARKLSMKVPLTLTRFEALLYIDCIILINHSPKPKSPTTILKTCFTKFLGTPTNAKYMFLFCFFDWIFLLQLSQDKKKHLQFHLQPWNQTASHYCPPVVISTSQYLFQLSSESDLLISVPSSFLFLNHLVFSESSLQ